MELPEAMQSCAPFRCRWPSPLLLPLDPLLVLQHER